MSERSKKREDYLEAINPERREFVKKIIAGAFIVPAVVSVSMHDQKLNVSAAMAASPNQTNPD
jgi:hypothetical protein